MPSVTSLSQATLPARTLRPSHLALLSLLLSLVTLPAASAQAVSIYGTVSPTYLNHLYTLSNAPTPQSTLTGQWFLGFNAGVTLDFASSDRVTYGLDFRGGPQIGTPGLGSALAGFRIGTHTPFLNLKPYGQVSLGFLEQRHQTGSGISLVTDAESYFAAELLAGVDYPISRHLDLRAVEVGIGTTKLINNNYIITSAHPRMLLLNSGIVYHF